MTTIPLTCPTTTRQLFRSPVSLVCISQAAGSLEGGGTVVAHVPVIAQDQHWDLVRNFLQLSLHVVEGPAMEHMQHIRDCKNFPYLVRNILQLSLHIVECPDMEHSQHIRDCKNFPYLVRNILQLSLHVVERSAMEHMQHIRDWENFPYFAIFFLLKH